MRKTFVSNLILLVGLNLLIKPFYILGIEAEIQDRVGAAHFGSYFALINFSILLNILPDLGITNWNTRRVAQEGKLNAQYLGTLFKLRGILALVYAVACLAIGAVLGYSNEQMYGLLLLVFNQIIAATILFLRSNLAGLHLFKQDSFLSILDKLLLVLGLGWMLWGIPDLTFQVEWLIYAQTIALTATAVLALYWVIKHSAKWNMFYDKNLQRQILRESAPFATLTLFGMIIYRADSVMLERMSSSEEAGMYATGFRIFEAYGMISYLFAALLLPIFSRMIKANENIKELVLLSSKVLFTATWVFCIFCFLMPLDVLSLIYDQPSQHATEAFRWLMPGCLAFSMQYIYGTLLTADGQLKQLNWIMISVSLINIILNILFIPDFGAVASAQINGISHLIILTTQITLVMRYFKWGALALFRDIFLFAILTTVAGLFIFNKIPGITIIDLTFPYSSGLFFLIALLLAYSSRMISPQKLILLLRAKE